MEARKKNPEGNKETKREGQSKVIKPLKDPGRELTERTAETRTKLKVKVL